MSNCSSKVKSGHISALLPGAIPPAAPTPVPAPGPPPPAALPGFDDSSWKLIDAPHDMLIHQNFEPQNSEKMAFIARNSGVYRKHFKLPSEWKGSSVWLYFEGVFHETTSYLNGRKISFHQQGYTSFALRLDDVPGLKYGTEENVLALFVDASTGTGWWYEGGGLIRHNFLVRANPTHIEQDGAWVYTNSTHSADDSYGGGALFHTSVQVVDDAAVVGDAAGSSVGAVAASATALSIRTTIRDAAGATVATATSPTVSDISAPIVVTATAPSGINYWSVKAPHLYTVTVELISGGGTIDSINISTGVRTIRFDADSGLYVNKQPVKLRGFCDHSSFAGVGAAVADRIELFRAQALRAVGGNSWRMAHNPPAVARLDMMDALGMLALDENRDYGGHVGQGGLTPETVEDELLDMRDLIKRDRSHPSIIWWSFCNEVGCTNESSAKAFREISKLWDPTRAVTQNRHGTSVSSAYLDVQGFSHRNGRDFDEFHAQYPTQPMAATECCSCMSQRGVDEDVCPYPKDGGCDQPGPAVAEGVYYNNNIGKCTADQVLRSDSRPTGTQCIQCIQCMQCIQCIQYTIHLYTHTPDAILHILILHILILHTLILHTLILHTLILPPFSGGHLRVVRLRLPWRG
jgi:hypothetical protein